jgi:endonuclease/exonuclease/phosphatase family metal-dependent hydrolase
MKPRGLRILSANLANGQADAGGFAALVEAVEPDVVTVQEIVPEQADALARLLPFGKLEPARDHKGMGIALKAAGSVRLLQLPYRSAFVAELSWAGDGEPIEVLNVHLAAPHVHPIVQRIWDRRGQVRGIVAHLDATPRRRRVLVGDLNATPLWPAYRRLRERLDDAAAEAARRSGRRPGRTWGPWSGALRLFRIDHVLVSGLVATETRVLPLQGSDHSALVADLAPAEP